MKIIKALQNEIIDLIGLQSNLLLELSQQKDIWQGDTQSEGITPKKIGEYRQSLDNDCVKVKNLESVIAVIGTMKAGKSTTINALVGQEILPHRVMPMTTLPTLIRHKSGQKEPVMTISNVSLFNDLADKVRKELGNKEDDEHGNMQDAVETITDGGEIIRNKLSGINNIRKALIFVNDLFRLARHLEINVDKDLGDFQDIRSLPCIEIEFRYLANLDLGLESGSLALLDTPGPNEAGQSDVLKRVLSDQIKNNASVVLFVMNYTQLNSDQDSDIRSQIKDIQDVFKDRSFVIVNRFERNSRRDMSFEKTREVAAEIINEEMEDDFIKKEDVFPVSSFWAFIAGQAQCQIENGFNLQGFISNPLNEDFIDRAFEFDDEEITEERIRDRCSALMEKSRYSEFVENMLKKAYMKSGKDSLLSSLARLKKHCNGVDLFATAIFGGLGEELEKLKESIEMTSDLMEQMKNAEEAASRIKDQGVKDYEEKVCGILDVHINDLKRSLEEKFSMEEELIKDKINKDKDELESARKEIFRFLNLPIYFSATSAKEDKFLIKNIKDLEDILKNRKVENGVVDFMDNKKEAEEFSAAIHEIIDGEIKNMEAGFEKSLEALEDYIRKEIEGSIIKDIGNTFGNYDRFMKGKGYDFDKSFIDDFSLMASIDNFDFNHQEGLIEEEEQERDKTQKKRVKRDDYWHKFLRFMRIRGSDSDYVEKIITSKEKYISYKISISTYLNLAISQAKDFQEYCRGKISSEFDDNLGPKIEAEFGKILDHISSLSGGLDNAKKLYETNKGAIESTAKIMGEIKNRNRLILKRSETALNGINLIGHQGESRV